MDAVFMHVQTDLVQGFEIAELLGDPIDDKMVHLIHPVVWVRLGKIRRV
jgi:hypothetical protein